MARAWTTGRGLRAATALLVVLGALTWSAGPADATVICLQYTGTALLRVGVQDDTATLEVVGSDVHVNGGYCRFSIFDIDTIEVVGNPGTTETLHLYLTTPFTPGRTVEPDIPEIEIDVDFTDASDRFYLHGSADNDQLWIGNEGISVNNDGDVDIFPNNSKLIVSTGTGLDFVTGMGGMGTGSPYPSGLSIFGGPDDDILIGTPQQDYIAPSTGDDTVDGQDANNDVVAFDTPVTADLRNGRATGPGGTDTLTNVEWLNGSNYDDVLIGDDQHNVINGMDGDDRLFGNGGPDTLAGYDGDDFIDGGRGPDTANYTAASGPVTVDLETQQAWGAHGTDTLADIERAGGSHYDDVLIASSRGSVLLGFGGDDDLFGGDGSDTIHGYEGDDEIFGGARRDIITTGPGNDYVEGGRGADDISNDAGEDTIDGGRGRDTINGSDDRDVLIGGGNDDVINGHGGDDTLLGQDGDDTLDGGSGTDHCQQGAGNGTVVNCP